MAVSASFALIDGAFLDGGVVPEGLDCREVQVVAAHLGTAAVDAGEELENVLGSIDRHRDHRNALLSPRET